MNASPFMLQLLTIGLFSTSSCSGTVTLTSSSADSDVCPGDTVVFTCVTDTGQLHWKTDDGLIKSYHSPSQVGDGGALSNFGGIYILKLIGANSNGTFESTAEAQNVSLTDDGKNITCSDQLVDGFDINAKISITQPPSSPLNVSSLFDCNSSIITISWVAPLDAPLCVHSYTVTISDSSLIMVYNTTDTSLNITDLTPGNEYSVTVAGRDGAGRLGDIVHLECAASDLDIIANVTYEHLKLKDSILILIQWKKTRYVTTDHEFEYYLIEHNVSSDQSPMITNRSNVTLFGVKQGETYSMKIFPFPRSISNFHLIVIKAIDIPNSPALLNNSNQEINTTRLCMNAEWITPMLVLPWLLTTVLSGILVTMIVKGRTNLSMYIITAHYGGDQPMTMVVYNMMK